MSELLDAVHDDPAFTGRYDKQIVVIGERATPFRDDGKTHIEYGNELDACEYFSLKNLRDEEWGVARKLDTICDVCLFQIGQTFDESGVEEYLAMSQEEAKRWKKDAKKEKAKKEKEKENPKAEKKEIGRKPRKTESGTKYVETPHAIEPVAKDKRVETVISPEKKEEFRDEMTLNFFGYITEYEWEQMFAGLYDWVDDPFKQGELYENTTH